MLVITHSPVATASPPAIFAVYRDVAGWPTWDPDTRSAVLHGGLTLGATGTLVPTKGRAIPITVTALQPDQAFTLTSKTWAFHLVFEHELTPAPGGTEILHRVRIGGLLKPLLARILVPAINHGLPTTLAQLKARVEG